MTHNTFKTLPSPPFKTIFMGTPVFSAAHLLMLLANPDIFRVTAVFTQPDRPVGRSKQCEPPPVKHIALKHKLPVYQPLTLKDACVKDILKPYAPDLLIVVAYGHILPDAILDIPLIGTYNVHASLLPKYRGASPVHSALLNGDSETGITIIKLDSGIDTGAMLVQKKIPVELSDDCASLTDKLQTLGANTLVSLWQDASNTKQHPQMIAQNAHEASYVKKIHKSMAPIRWQESALLIHNQIRALNIWPVCSAEMHHLKLGNILIKIYKSLPIASRDYDHLSPGHIFQHPEYKLCVKCGTGYLQILELQLPGKKRLPANLFMQGFSFQNSDCFY